MKHLSLLTLLFALYTCVLSAQTTIIGRPARWKTAALDSTFSEYSVFTIDTKAITKALQESHGTNAVQLSIEDKNWTLLAESAAIAPANTPVQTEFRRSTTAFDPTFKGYNSLGQSFRLSANDGYIAGMIPLGDKEFFIEPLRNIDARAPKNLYLLYEKSAWKVRIGRKCLVSEVEQQLSRVPNNASRSSNCVTVDLAVATDLSMYRKYSSSTAEVQNRVASIMNLVEGLYQTSFAYKIKFTIVTWYHSTTTDPWTGSSSAGTVLDNFSAWAPSGFGVNYDLGQFWTNRDFEGSTIGIAWVGGVCGGKLRHHAVQDFSSSDAYMRCMVAHEIGHNFNMTHNSDIMAPTVSVSTTWSATSISQINSCLPSVVGPACLTPCTTSGGGGSSGTPPVADFSVTANDTFCINRQIQFEDRSQNNPYTYSWTFEGGTPATSALQNPKVVYKNAGTYSVSLVASNAYGSNTKTVRIIAVAAPVVGFTYKINALNVDFTNTTTGTASWLWKFGDTKTSTEKNPSHTYANNGSFNVQLSATNACGTKVTSKLVPVFAATPNAKFSVSSSSGCAPLTVQLINSSSNAQTYSWSLPGAKISISADKNPVAVYENPGSYDIILVAFNGSLSDTFLMKNAVTIRSSPQLDFEGIVLDGGLVQFRNQSVAADTILWDFGDGNVSTDTLPFHFYRNSGEYTVKLSASNPCGSTFLEKKISILLAPVAGFRVDSLYRICKNETITLENTSSSDAESFTWKLPLAKPDSSNERNPIIAYSKSGTYEIKLIAENAAGADTISKTIEVVLKVDPIAAFRDSTAGLTVHCSNRSTTAQTFSWDFGDGNSSTEPNPIHSYAMAGVYEIRLKAFNECDSSAYSLRTEVFSKPKAKFSHKADSLCAPGIIAFHPEISGKATELRWYFEGGYPSESTDSIPTVQYNSAGVFGVALVAINPAGNDSIYKKDYLVIQEKPVASFTVLAKGAELTFENSSLRAREYLWDFGDGAASVEPNPVHIYKQKGDYIVRLQAKNECGTATYSRGISLDFTADKEANEAVTINVFPNPTTGIFTVVLPESRDEPLRFIVRNPLGQEIINRVVARTEKGHSESFDLSGFPSGNYLLEINTCLSTNKVSNIRYKVQKR